MNNQEKKEIEEIEEIEGYITKNGINAINKLELAQEKEDEWKEFDEKFTELRFGDGTIEGGGKSAWLAIKRPDMANEIKEFISTHYISKKALKERIEGMKKYAQKNGEEYVPIQYNSALQDILDLITNTK